jgi:hypothetical protein
MRRSRPRLSSTPHMHLRGNGARAPPSLEYSSRSGMDVEERLASVMIHPSRPLRSPGSY